MKKNEVVEISKLVIGREYLVDSGLGGCFHTRYAGTTKDGKHFFKNIHSEDWLGYDYKIDDMKKYNVREI